ncbi:FAD-dependent monooxygenase [Luteolibacter yonseiensis]|uniref:FAD-dependent monooxygenase n=1 Tax=Luteolibacter yonseiensis TaxID=1144680 RepID=A0A934R3Q8_9BACT|nr:FAD-dependent monooxygenase [Luteolibacter yonseiensis]MBK1817833.1 FAD-dependent monooxygenase [Luteolibacter yonseiensis]
MNREITIAGGGLAGLSLACALRAQGVAVTVLEAGNYPRHRVCGEFISGVTDDTLSRLGVAELFADARFHHSLAWHNQGQLIHRARLKTPALGISRHLLDERLRNHAVGSGAVVRTNVRAKPVAREGFVWTAGRRPTNGTWIGLKMHVKGLPLSEDLEMHCGTNGYAGLAGVEDGWTNACGLFRLDRSIRAEGPGLLPAYLEAGGNQALAEHLRSAEYRERSFSAVAGFQLGRQIPIPGMLALGDAESMIPPFTGNGMSMAFQAAELAVAPLAAWSRDGRSWQETTEAVRAAVSGKFRRRLAVAGALHPLLLGRSGRSLLQCLASARLLPFQPMLSLIR